MFDRYSEKARRIIFFARYEANRLGATQVEADHLLLGLMREDENLTTRLLNGSQGEIGSLHKEVENRSTLREPSSAPVNLPLSGEVKRVLAFAAETSEELGHYRIGPKHLLLGLLHERESVTAATLHRCGLSYEDELGQAHLMADTQEVDEVDLTFENEKRAYSSEEFSLSGKVQHNWVLSKVTKILRRALNRIRDRTSL